MKIFISHAEKDEALARQLAQSLSDAGLEVWNPYEEIAPGDNWAMKVGEALEGSDLMVILVTPGALESESLQHEIDYALSHKRYRGRLISVMVGPTVEMPWILLRQPTAQIESPRDIEKIVDEIAALAH